MRELLEAHRAAVESMRIVSQSSAMLGDLAVAMQMHHKFKPEDTPGEYKRRATDTVRQAKNLVSSGFAYQRGMLLVALCGLLDVTVRKVIAECLVADNTLIGKLPNELGTLCTRIVRRKKKDEDLFDDLFSIVDRQFKNFPENGTISHTARFRYWLSRVDQEPSTSPKDDLVIDHGYLARNWVIHRSKSTINRLRRQDSKLVDSKNNIIQIGQTEIASIAKAYENFLGGIGFGNL